MQDCNHIMTWWYPGTIFHSADQHSRVQTGRCFLKHWAGAKWPWSYPWCSTLTQPITSSSSRQELSYQKNHSTSLSTLRPMTIMWILLLSLSISLCPCLNPQTPYFFCRSRSALVVHPACYTRLFCGHSTAHGRSLVNTWQDPHTTSEHEF